jgi:DNA-binding GntR family transcriptional regulator
LPSVDRLALEMASNEDIERRALEGELASLAEAWKEAEEIANISDELFADEVFEEFKRQYTHRVSRADASEE